MSLGGESYAGALRGGARDDRANGAITGSGVNLYTSFPSERSNEMDSSKAGRVIAEQLEAIEQEYGDSDEHDIGVVITIIEITGPDGSELRVGHNLEDQPYRLVGLMRGAEERLLAMFRSWTD
jgi:hypothetical protein